MCIDTYPVGGRGQLRPSIHSSRPSKCYRSNGLFFRDVTNVLDSAQTADFNGKTDHRPSIKSALQLLGGLPSADGVEVKLTHQLPKEVE